MKRNKTKKIIIGVVVGIVLVIIILAIWLGRFIKGVTDERGSEIRKELTEILEAVENQDEDEFEQYFSGEIKEQTDVLEEFDQIVEYIGEDVEVQKGRVVSSRFETSGGYTTGEMCMQWNVISNKGKFDVLIQRTYNPDPMIDGIIYIWITDVGDDDGVFIGVGY